MKQACKVRGGASRREREKRCGRNQGEHEKLAAKWTPRTDVAKESETPGRCSTASAGEQERTATYSEGEREAHGRMNPESQDSRGPVWSGTPRRSGGNTKARAESG